MYADEFPVGVGAAPTPDIGTIFFETVQALSRTIERRDPFTAGHQQRVAELAVELAKALGLDEGARTGLRLGALVHDIGKIGVPIELLSRPDVLGPQEFDLVRAHVRIGHEILKDIPFPWPVARMVFEHHERLDGSGYPMRLRGDEICMEARILGVADVIDAITSDRPYRPGLGIGAALDEIEDRAGTAYDATVVEAATGLLRDPRSAFARSFIGRMVARSRW